MLVPTHRRIKLCAGSGNRHHERLVPGVHPLIKNRVKLPLFLAVELIENDSVWFTSIFRFRIGADGTVKRGWKKTLLLDRLVPKLHYNSGLALDLYLFMSKSGLQLKNDDLKPILPVGGP